MSDRARVPSVITSEVVNQLLLAIAEEMGIALKKTSFSPNIKERADCSTACFDAQGRVVVQAAHIPIHLSSMLGLIDAMVRLGASEPLAPGDMFVANDPFTAGGSHLNDIAAAMPVFAGSELIGFVANIAHHSDVGGRVPGSEVGDNTDIFQDGLRLPLLRVMRGGRLLRDVMELLLLNSRTPDERRGDFDAQFAANLLGARRLEELHRRFGHEVYGGAIDALLDYTEQRARSEIRKLPRGSFRARGGLEDDGVGSTPVPIEVRVDVGDGDMVFDFTGTSPQVATSVNSTPISLLAGIYYVARAVLDPTLPTNAGFYRPFRLDVPPGTLLNALPPASIALRFRSVQRAVELVCEALAPAMPDRVPAGGAGWVGVIISGLDPRRRQTFVDYEAYVGGGGAKASKDGWDSTWSHCSNSSNLPIEVLEAEYPLRVARYALREDSGGPGKFRGGLGCVRKIQAAGGAVRFGIRGDGYRFPGRGLFGGKPGATAVVVKSRGRRRERLPAVLASAVLAPGETLSLLTPGGGGFGSPLDRDPARVLADVTAGKVSVKQAANEYGVIIRNSAVDEERTRRARARMRQRTTKRQPKGGRR
jgi:N-methylhydantoinase B